MNDQRRFTMIRLPPADRKHMQAPLAATSKQSRCTGTNLPTPEGWEAEWTLAGKKIYSFNLRATSLSAILQSRVTLINVFDSLNTPSSTGRKGPPGKN